MLYKYCLNIVLKIIVKHEKFHIIRAFLSNSIVLSFLSHASNYFTPRTESRNTGPEIGKCCELTKQTIIILHGIILENFPLITATLPSDPVFCLIDFSVVW
jgi:hypothetical protein